MPEAGKGKKKKHFAYTAAGRKAAKTYAKKTGTTVKNKRKKTKKR